MSCDRFVPYLAKLSTCQRWKSRILGLPGFPVPPGVFIPECEQDGSFRTVQCLGSTGQCWCVTKDGFMIWTTITRGRPSCDKKGRYATDSRNLPYIWHVNAFHFSTYLTSRLTAGPWLNPSLVQTPVQSCLFLMKRHRRLIGVPTFIFEV